MLTQELMGLLGLGILWVNTLLVVLAARTPLAALISGARRKLQRAVVVEGADDGTFAVHVVQQVGRKASDDAGRQAILFHDRGYRSEVAGGVLHVEGGGRVVVDADQAGQIWVPREERLQLSEFPGAEFDDAYRMSQKAKGYARELRSHVREKQTVWFAPATEDANMLVATFDARGWLRARVAMVITFQLGMLSLSALATWLCLYPPIFGPVSTAGGLLGLVHFLLIMQPLGVTVREAALLPHEGIVRGSWAKPDSEGTGVDANLGTTDP